MDEVVDDDARARPRARAPRGDLIWSFRSGSRRCRRRRAEALLGRGRVHLGDRAREGRQSEELEIRGVERIPDEVRRPARGLRAQAAHEVLAESLGERVHGLVDPVAARTVGRTDLGETRAGPRESTTLPASSTSAPTSNRFRSQLVEEDRGDRGGALADRHAQGRAPPEALEGDLRDAARHDDGFP